MTKSIVINPRFSFTHTKQKTLNRRKCGCPLCHLSRRFLRIQLSFYHRSPVQFRSTAALRLDCGSLLQPSSLHSCLGPQLISSKFLFFKFPFLFSSQLNVIHTSCKPRVSYHLTYVVITLLQCLFIVLYFLKA